MPLPWVRLDCNVASHDKVLRLLSDPSPRRWQAFTTYVCAVAWSGGHDTDGYITRAALPFVHGTPLTARLLVKYELWDERADGWDIRNYSEYQQTVKVTEEKRELSALGGRKSACVRAKHPAGCTCWKEPA